MKWSYFYALDAQGRLTLPNEVLRALSDSTGYVYPDIRGVLCRADTALGILKPCILFQVLDLSRNNEEDFPQGVWPVAVAGYNSNRGNAVYEDGRIRLKKHQIFHLCGKSQIGGLSKRDRTMLLIGLGNYMAITNSNLW